jgi:hypothetical protein
MLNHMVQYVTQGLAACKGRPSARYVAGRASKSGSTQWVDYTGLGECAPLWHGRAQLDTINLEGPTKHIEGLTVRLFKR